MNDGGSAFPKYFGTNPDMARGEVAGMSLRDYFAGQMLTGVYAGGTHIRIADGIAARSTQLEMGLSAGQIGHEAEKRIAAMCYATADAMLAARENAK